MRTPPTGQITSLLKAWNSGDQKALSEVTPLVYNELLQIARRCLAHDHQPQRLAATELINELYLRLASAHEVGWQDRTHFFAICARQMRWVLTDVYRAQHAAKRGGAEETVQIGLAADWIPDASVTWIEVNDALEQLAQAEPRQCRVVELRIFGGLSVRETAEALKIAPETVQRDWKAAKAWLRSALENSARG
ncbi:MAG: ECF-type sigma factor [Terriglobales bacterium]